MGPCVFVFLLYAILIGEIRNFLYWSQSEHIPSCSSFGILFPTKYFDFWYRAHIWSKAALQNYPPEPFFGNTVTNHHMFHKVWKCIFFHYNTDTCSYCMQFEAYQWRLVDDNVKTIHDNREEIFTPLNKIFSMNISHDGMVLEKNGLILSFQCMLKLIQGKYRQRYKICWQWKVSNHYADDTCEDFSIVRS